MFTASSVFFLPHAAKENAIMEVLVAIGTYSINKTAYETQINAATTLEEVAAALAAANQILLLRLLISKLLSH